MPNGLTVATKRVYAFTVASPEGVGFVLFSSYEPASSHTVTRREKRDLRRLHTRSRECHRTRPGRIRPIANATIHMTSSRSSRQLRNQAYLLKASSPALAWASPLSVNLAISTSYN